MPERYRSERPFARGAMAELHLGVSLGAEGFEKPVVIKRILPHLAQDKRLVQLFSSEAKLSTLLNHQNIVSTIDVGRDAEGLFIVMERVEGWDLGAVLAAAAAEGKPFPPQLAAYVGSQIMAGLCYAYRQTQDGKPLMAAHRDVSGSNVLLSRSGEVKVADFGIAPFDDAVEVSEASHLKGKIAYCAPELLRREPASPLSDQFSVGVLLFEMLLLRHPYGKLHNVMEYLQSLRDASPPSMPGVPRALTKWVQQALNPKKEKRIKKPEALAKGLLEQARGCGPEELARFLESLPLRPPPASPARLKAVPDLSTEETENSAFPFDPTEQPWSPLGPELNAEGKLEGTLDAPAISAGAHHHRPSFETAEPLELAGAVPVSGEGSGTIDLAPETPLYHGRRSKLPKLLLYLALSIALASWTYWDDLGPLYEKGLRVMKHETEEQLRGPPPPILRIESDPPGAHVWINGTDLGTTPLYQENHFPKRLIEVTLSRPGYRAWKGTFDGGVEAMIEAQLSRTGK